MIRVKIVNRACRLKIGKNGGMDGKEDASVGGRTGIYYEDYDPPRRIADFMIFADLKE